MLLRSLRRADVPLVHSQGFNPKPRVSFGPALSVGVASEGEYMDFECWEPLDADELLERVRRFVRELRVMVTGMGWV